MNLAARQARVDRLARLTPTAVLVGPALVDLAAPATSCPSCAIHRAGARHAHELHLAAEERKEIAQLETDLAKARAELVLVPEPVKANRVFGGVA